MHGVLLVCVQLLLPAVSPCQSELAVDDVYKHVPSILSLGQAAEVGRAAAGTSESDATASAARVLRLLSAWRTSHTHQHRGRRRCKRCHTDRALGSGTTGFWMKILRRLLRPEHTAIRSACQKYCATTAIISDELSVCVDECCERHATIKGGEVSTMPTPLPIATATATATSTAFTTVWSTSTTESTTATNASCSAEDRRGVRAMCGESQVVFGYGSGLFVLCRCSEDTGLWQWEWEGTWGNERHIVSKKVGKPISGQADNTSAPVDERCGPLSMQSYKGIECPVYCNATAGQYGYIENPGGDCPEATNSKDTPTTTTTAATTTAITTTSTAATPTSRQECSEEGKHGLAAKCGEPRIAFRGQRGYCTALCSCNEDTRLWQWGWDWPHCDSLGKPAKASGNSTLAAALENDWCGPLSMQSVNGTECPMYCNVTTGEYGYTDDPADCPQAIGAVNTFISTTSTRKQPPTTAKATSASTSTTAATKGLCMGQRRPSPADAAVCGESVLHFHQPTGGGRTCVPQCRCEPATGEWRWTWMPRWPALTTDEDGFCDREVGQLMKSKAGMRPHLMVTNRKCGHLAVASAIGTECTVYCNHATGEAAYIHPGPLSGCPISQLPYTVRTTAAASTTSTAESTTTVAKQQCSKEAEQEHSNVKCGPLSIRYDRKGKRCEVMCYCNADTDQWQWEWKRGQTYCDKLGRPVKTSNRLALNNKWCGNLAMSGKKGKECPMYCFGERKYGYIKNPGNDCPML